VLIIMSLLSTAIAAGAADLVWRSRHDADLRRRWRTRPRQPWHLT
jgi:hypothetical protein